MIGLRRRRVADPRATAVLEIATVGLSPTSLDWIYAQPFECQQFPLALKNPSCNRRCVLCRRFYGPGHGGQHDDVYSRKLGGRSDDDWALWDDIRQRVCRPCLTGEPDFDAYYEGLRYQPVVPLTVASRYVPRLPFRCATWMEMHKRSPIILAVCPGCGELGPPFGDPPSIGDWNGSTFRFECCGHRGTIDLQDGGRAGAALLGWYA